MSVKLPTRWITQPWIGKIETLLMRLMCCSYPLNRLFLGVMGMGAECEMGVGREKKSLGTKQMLCSFTDIFASLSSWRVVSLAIITQLATQCSSPRFLGKVLVKNACPEKFSQCLIKGFLIAKVEPHNNEWYLIMMTLCLIMFKRCLIMIYLMIKTKPSLWQTCA